MKRSGFLLAGLSVIVGPFPCWGAFERGGPLGFGARAMGMGGAWTAAGGDLSSLYWNPAGLHRVENGEIELEGGSLSAGKDHTGLAAGALALNPRSRLALGAEMLGRPGGSSLSERSLKAAFAASSPGLGPALGGAVRYLNFGGPAGTGLSGHGLAMDAGVQGAWRWSPESILRGGLALLDFGGRLKWGTGGVQKLPARLSAGVAVTPGGSASFALDISTVAWGPPPPGRGPVIRSGLELVLLEGRALVRGGYVGSRTHSGLFTAGFTVRGKAWQVHYAYAGQPGSLGQSHRLALGLALGQPSWVPPGSSGGDLRARLLGIEEKLKALREQASAAGGLKEDLERDRIRLLKEKVETLGSLPGGAAGPEGPDPARARIEDHPLFKKALEFMAQGEFQREAEIWRVLLKTYPNDPKLRENLNRAEQRLRGTQALENLGGNPR